VTVVDFYADWCGPCKQLSPSLEQMARTDPEIALRKIDIVNVEHGGGEAIQHPLDSAR
jgi:thioredoxin 1